MDACGFMRSLRWEPHSLATSCLQPSPPPPLLPISPPVQVPRHWKFLAPGEAFPMTLSGKIQKFRMREAMVAELGLQAAAVVRTC